MGRRENAGLLLPHSLLLCDSAQPLLMCVPVRGTGFQVPTRREVKEATASHTAPQQAAGL